VAAASADDADDADDAVDAMELDLDLDPMLSSRDLAHRQ
jgi:hypothetical protein